MPSRRSSILLLFFLLTPQGLFAQAVDQERSGLYVCTEAGATCSQATLSACMSVAASRGVSAWVPTVDRSKAPCIWSITSNLTPTVPLVIPEGTMIDVASGVTLTLNACPAAGAYRIFGQANGDPIAGNVSLPATCPILPNWFDDTDAIASGINQAVAAAPSTGARIDATAFIGTIDETITLDKPVEVRLGMGTYTYAGPGCAFDVQSNSVALIGRGSKDRTLLSVTGTAGTERGVCSTGGVRLFRFKMQDIWLNGTDTTGTQGLRMHDIADQAYVERVRITNFHIGIDIDEGVGGCHRGEYHDVEISANVGSGIVIENGCNSNRFFGGRMQSNNVHFDVNQGNNNVIFGMILENAGDYCIRLEATGGNGNTVVGNRFEGCTNGAVLVAGNRNKIWGNYHSSGGPDGCRNTGENNEVWCNAQTVAQISSPSPLGGYSYLKNGSFEYDSQTVTGLDGRPDGWAFSATTNNTESITMPTTDAQCGTRRVLLNNTDSVGARITQGTLLDPGDWVMAFRGKCDAGTTSCQVRMGTGGSASSDIGTRNVDGDNVWRDYLMVFHLDTEETVTISIMMNTSGAVNFTADCMGLYAGTAAPTFSESPCHTHTFEVNPAEVSANTTGNTAVDITGLTTDHVVAVNPPATLNTGLVVGGAYVSNSDELTFRLGNLTGSPINPAEATYAYSACRR